MIYLIVLDTCMDDEDFQAVKVWLPNFCINFLMVLEINFVYPVSHFEVMLAGLSLRDRDRGFPPVTINVAPSYFHRKIGEKYNQKKFLAV